jgi:hypothetical protein
MASQDTLMVFGPLENRPPAADYATPDLRNGFVVLDFDAATAEAARFVALLPSHYRGGGFVPVVKWTSTSATSGSVRLQVALTRLAAGANLDSPPAVAATTTFTATVPATSGQIVESVGQALTVADATTGDLLLVEVARLASDALDTMAGDLEFIALEIQEE